jgi:hypothetical protein
MKYLLAAAALLAAGCTTHEDIVASGEAACLSYGHTRGTDPFRQCVQAEVLATQERMNTALSQMGRQGWAPPTPLSLP